MRALIAGLVAIPVLDQALKLLILRRLGGGSVALGHVGRLEVVRSRIWLARSPRPPGPAALWALWVLAAAALTTVTAVTPSVGVFAGLLLGASLSQGLESARRGWICDYVCPRFWPAFNLADVALGIGAIGMGVGVWR